MRAPEVIPFEKRMTFNILIDQPRMILWDLSFKEAALLSFIKTAESVKTLKRNKNGKVWLAKALILRQMPSLSNRQDAIQRIEKALVDKELIEKEQESGRVYYATTKKADCWNLMPSVGELESCQEIAGDMVMTSGGREKSLPRAGSAEIPTGGSEKSTTGGSGFNTTRGRENPPTNDCITTTSQDELKKDETENPISPNQPKENKTEPPEPGKGLLRKTLKECDGRCKYEHNQYLCPECEIKKQRCIAFADKIYSNFDKRTDVWKHYFDLPKEETISKCWFYYRKNNFVSKQICKQLDKMIDSGRYKKDKTISITTAIEHAAAALDLEERQ